LIRPSGPSSLNRMTSLAGSGDPSRRLWRPLSRGAVEHAGDHQQPACLRGMPSALRQPTKSPARVVRTHRKWMSHGKRSPFAILNHCPAGLGTLSQPICGLVFGGARRLEADVWRADPRCRNMEIDQGHRVRTPSTLGCQNGSRSGIKSQLASIANLQRLHPAKYPALRRLDPLPIRSDLH